jgi:poly(3-hydroxybutyrate) depolymerase
MNALSLKEPWNQARDHVIELPDHYDTFFYSAFNSASQFLRGAHSNMATVARLSASALRFSLCPPDISQAFDNFADHETKAAQAATRPDFDFGSIHVNGRDIAVQEETIDTRPFGDLINFTHGNTPDQHRPKVLIVSPMSGNFATIMSETVERLIPNHDVHITHWHNARDVHVKQGRFGVDTYVDYLNDWIDELGPNTHLLTVSQSTVPGLVATSLAAQRGRTEPASLTMMAGPLFPGASPTALSRFASEQPFEFFKNHLVHKVPHGFDGVGRAVYPGDLQQSLIKMASGQMGALNTLFNPASGGKTPPMDLAGEYYLETIDRVFKKQHLPNRTYQHHDISATGKITGREKIDLRAIHKTALLVIEGEQDNLTAPGQTSPVLEWAKNVKSARKFHHIEPEAGHYDTIQGPKWNGNISNKVIDFISKNDIS